MPFVTESVDHAETQCRPWRDATDRGSLPEDHGPVQEVAQYIIFHKVEKFVQASDGRKYVGNTGNGREQEDEARVETNGKNII